MAIRVLEKLIAEQIAAGEVIENPSSVVKELVENSLDAGSTRIEVSIEGGGKKNITVTDNGCGITPSEIPLAFRRFATSKLAALTDLDNLKTLGFRGEALPSIAAVSKVTLTTRRENDLAGNRIEINGGEIAHLEEVGCASGTTIIVRDLFFNTPGRKKFLRADAAESSRITYLLSNMALARPDTAFIFKSNNKVLFQSAGDGSLRHAFGSVYGPDSALALLSLKGSDPVNDCSLTGYISPPHQNRSARRWITVIVNGRLIRDPLIVSALERGYGNLLPSRRHPLAVIHLKTPPAMLDVNVHPAKIEIRFQNPEIIKSLVFRTVRFALGSSTASRSWPEPARPDYRFSSKERQQNFQFPKNPAPDRNLFVLETAAEAEKAQSPCPEAESRIEAESGGWEDYRLIGQYLHSYLVVQKESLLLLIDQHAAHERINYHRLQSEPDRRSKEIQLTMPVTIDIPVSWKEQFLELIPELQAAGFQLEPISENGYIVRAVPFTIGEDTSASAIYDLLEEIIAAEKEPGSDKKEKVFKTVACHRSVKAKQSLTTAEMEELLKEWSKVPNAEYCPHGRPAVISFTREQLEKGFDRKG